MTVRTIDDIFRDFVIDGVPASGPFNPHKPDIRDTLKKLLEGLSTFPDNRVIRLNNANTGTGNNIIVTASVEIPAAAYQVLYILNITQENTGPVTVSGSINRPVVTNISRSIEPGYLQPGMALLCVDTGTELRMLSYGDAEAIQMAAEAAADRAEASAAAVNLPPITSSDAGKVLVVKPDGAGYEKKYTNEASAYLNVKDYGAIGDGSTVDRQAFIDSINAAPAGYEIIVPSGDYVIGSDIPATNVRFKFIGNANLIGGRLVGALIVRQANDGSVSYGTGTFNQWTARYRFGSTASGITGIQIGGADPERGTTGNVIFNDGYAGWTTIQPSQYPSSAELAIQPSSIAGRCTLVSGTNTVQVTSSVALLAFLNGYTIYIEAEVYKITSVNIAAKTMTVQFIGGGTPSFTGQTNQVFLIAMVRGTGKCDVNGTAVTRLTGDPFVPKDLTGYNIRIDGTVYAVDTRTGYDAVILSSNAGVKTNVDYEFFTSISDLVAAVRVHRLSGAGFEENVTLAAYGTGHYRLQAASGNSNQRTFYIGNGYYPGGGKRNGLTFAGNGDVIIGGGFLKNSVRVVDMGDTASNNLLISGGLAGSPVLVATEGVDENIDLSLRPKGLGKIRFNSSIAGTVTPNRVLVCKDDTGATIHIPYYRVP